MLGQGDRHIMEGRLGDSDVVAVTITGPTPEGLDEPSGETCRSSSGGSTDPE